MTLANTGSNLKDLKNKLNWMLKTLADIIWLQMTIMIDSCWEQIFSYK